MPLVTSALEGAILRVLAGPRLTPAALVSLELAQAYFAYAAAASSTYGPFVPTGTEVLRLSAVLRAPLVSPVGSARGVAQAWGLGVQVFWTGAVFGVGVGSVVPGVPAMVGALTQVLSTPTNTFFSAARGIAHALDVGTRTLLIAGPSGPMPVV